MSYSAHREEFRIALERLQEHFPMVCLAAWTPDDYEAAVRGAEANWSDQKYVQVAKQLHELIKEDGGQNWDKVREAYRSGVTSSRQGTV